MNSERLPKTSDEDIFPVNIAEEDVQDKVKLLTSEFKMKTIVSAYKTLKIVNDCPMQE